MNLAAKEETREIRSVLAYASFFSSLMMNKLVLATFSLSIYLSINTSNFLSMYPIIFPSMFPSIIYPSIFHWISIQSIYVHYHLFFRREAISTKYSFRPSVRTYIMG